MSVLLDTHIVLWWRVDDVRLGPAARRAIANTEGVFVSAASVWEVAMKLSLNKIRIPEPFARGIERAGFARLPVTFEHAERVASLPLLHRDPFDRILIAQAQEEGLTIVTADRAFARYAVDVLWA